MKKTLRLFSLLLVAFVIAACAGTGETEDVSSALPTATPQTDVQEESTEQDEEVNTDPDGDGIDVDLTILSSTMVFAEVYNIVMNPSDYVGQIVKMTGTLNIYRDETTDSTVCAVIIMDATECCEQGIMFVFDSSYTYPDDYPEAGSIVTVIGEFDVFTSPDSPMMYSYLKEATLA